MVPLNRITEKWHAPLFRTALRRYISLLNDPELNAAQLERSLWDIHFPFHSLPVWKVVKYLNIDPVTGMKSTANSVHAKPACMSTQKHHIDGRFDTAMKEASETMVVKEADLEASKVCLLSVP